MYFSHNIIFPSQVIVAEHGLELWPGYNTSFTQCEVDVMLQAEIKYKVTRKDNVYGLLTQISRESGGVDLQVCSGVVFYFFIWLIKKPAPPSLLHCSTVQVVSASSYKLLIQNVIKCFTILEFLICSVCFYNFR